MMTKIETVKKEEVQAWREFGKEFNFYEINGSHLFLHEQLAVDRLITYFV